MRVCIFILLVQHSACHHPLPPSILPTFLPLFVACGKYRSDFSRLPPHPRTYCPMAGARLDISTPSPHHCDHLVVKELKYFLISTLPFIASKEFFIRFLHVHTTEFLDCLVCCFPFNFFSNQSSFSFIFRVFGNKDYAC